MCFGGGSKSQPPAVPPPDPDVTEQKRQTFESNANKLRDEKEASLDAERAKAYGFYGTRSLLGSSGSGLLAAQKNI